METNVNYTIVGLFVIIMVACFTLGVIWLSSGLTLEYYETYQVNMSESVSGLNLESPVEFNGVNVGSVKSIDIDEKNPQVVRLLLSIKSNTPITKGTNAALNVKGLTGMGFIALRDSGTDTAPLVALKGQEYPIINTTPSFLVRLDNEVTKMNAALHEVSASIQSLLDKENLRSVKKILNNFREITDTLTANRQDLRSILQHGAKASEIFSAQTLPYTNDAITNIDNMTSSLLGISQEIQQNPAVLIRGKAQRTLGPGE